MWSSSCDSAMHMVTQARGAYRPGMQGLESLPSRSAASCQVKPFVRHGSAQTPAMHCVYTVQYEWPSPSLD